MMLPYVVFFPNFRGGMLMKKLRLDPESLRVESYSIDGDARLRPGTVFGHEESDSFVTCKSCDFSGCDRTCAVTCYNCGPPPTEFTA